MTNNTNLNDLVRSIFAAQPLGILATLSNGYPYCTIVAFTPSDDLKSLLIATPRFTAKYNNMLKCPGVSLMVDNRSVSNSDFKEGLAVNCIGRALTVPEHEFEACRKLHFERHANLRIHLDSPDCALVRIEVERYVIARGVLHIETLSMM